MENEKPSYYAIIPANIRYDNRLKPVEKLMYGEITVLSNKQGFCTAGNGYFANLYERSTTTVSRWISHLEKCGYIKALVVRDENKQVKMRKVFITGPLLTKTSIPSPQKCQYPIDENVKENNTSNNNTSNNSNTLSGSKLHDFAPKETYSEIVDYLNSKAGKAFRSGTSSTKSLINGRLRDGFKIADFKQVIDNKCADWVNDTKMSEYLRPNTLFGNKFESYLNEKPKQVNNSSEALEGVNNDDIDW